MIKITNVTKEYPRRGAALQDVSVEIPKGQFVFLTGHSGSGKSLSARAAMGVLDVDPGLYRGSLYYPAVTGDKDWYEGVRGGGMRAQKRPSNACCLA